MYPYFTIAGYTLPSYGVMLSVAFFVALAVAVLRHKINGLSMTDTVVAMFMAGAGALLGGKLFHFFQGLPAYLATRAETGTTLLQYFNNAGLVFYGAMIGCILMLLVFAVVYKISFFTVIDALLPSLPLGQAIGRIGCFLVGCCWGIPFEGGLLFNASPFAPHDIPLLPVQLIESACTAVLFCVMAYYGRTPRKPGIMLSIYLIGYGSIRFVLEFFRYDAIRGHLGALSVSQWVSVALIVLGLFFTQWHKRPHAAQSSRLSK